MKPEIHRYFGAGTKTVTVYVVFSVMIATRLSITSSHMKTTGIADVPLNSVVGLPDSRLYTCRKGGEE